MYTKPELKTEKFEAADVIATSGDPVNPTTTTDFFEIEQTLLPENPTIQ